MFNGLLRAEPTFPVEILSVLKQAVLTLIAQSVNIEFAITTNKDQHALRRLAYRVIGVIRTSAKTMTRTRTKKTKRVCQKRGKNYQFLDL